MTDKSNCSQLQVPCDKISDNWWDLLCHHNIWLSLSSGGRSQGKIHSWPISSPATRNLKYFQVWLLAFPSTVFGSTKLSVILALWCFADWLFGYLWRVEKEKSERKQKWKFNVEIVTKWRPSAILSRKFRVYRLRIPSSIKEVHKNMTNC